MRSRFAMTLALAAMLTSAPAYAATPTPTPHSVPPAAPTPTSTANSPDAPDPHPPAGGVGPLGERVGGARLASRGVVLPAHRKPLPDLTARAWALVDLDSGDILAARDPHGRYQPASILKTLTSVTLLPMLPGDRTVTVNADAANAEGSAVGIVGGGRYTVDQLFTGLLLMSGNDTAAALAEAAGGVKHTVALMNRKAIELGAYDTFVQTPSGLDGWQQLTSAYDMAIFLRAAVHMPRFVAYDRQATGRLPAQHVHGHRYGSVWLGNQTENFLTGVPGALVAKTGFTDAASHTFLCAASRGGRRLGVVFLRAERYPLDQWQQAAALLDWGYSLPRDASVGHLDAPATAGRSADGTAPASGSGSGSGSGSSSSAATTRHHDSSTMWPVIAIVAAAAAAGALWLARRRIIRPR